MKMYLICPMPMFNYQFSFLIACFLPAFLFAQEIEREVLGSVGGIHQNTAVSMEWTIGEVMVETYQSGAIQLTQGFHQPRIVITGLNEKKENLGKVALYPNPTQQYLTVDLAGEWNLHAIQLFDVVGTLLFDQTFENGFQKKFIDLQPYANGTYLLRISYDQGKEYSIHKVIKK